MTESLKSEVERKMQISKVSFIMNSILKIQKLQNLIHCFKNMYVVKF